jgi:glycosyltransferase involved in cell wall biosynthesis
MKNQKNKNIKLLTEYFHPEPASTGQLMTQLAVGLQKEGFNVEVFTSQPTYQGQEISKLPNKENYKGVKINRLNSTQLNKEKGIFRIINWITFTFLVIVNIFRKSKSSDILLILSNPPVLPFVGLLFKLLRKQRYAIIIYDIYPDMAVVLGMAKENNPIVKLWHINNRILFENADKIIVLGKRMKQKILEKTNGRLDSSKIQIIHNWENPEFIKPVDKKRNTFSIENGYDKKLTLLYSGNLGQHHDLMTIIEAAEKVKALPVKFVFIGDGAQKRKLQDYVEDKNLKNVDFHPYQPLERLPETLTCADVSIVYEDLSASGLCVSCKIYSSLASGGAILAMVDKNSDIAHIVKECNCGIQVNQENEEEIEEAVKFWLSKPEQLHSMGINGRKCFEKRFTLKKAIRNYAKILESS